MDGWNHIQPVGGVVMRVAFIICLQMGVHDVIAVSFASPLRPACWDIHFLLGVPSTRVWRVKLSVVVLIVQIEVIYQFHQQFCVPLACKYASHFIPVLNVMAPNFALNWVIIANRFPISGISACSDLDHHNSLIHWLGVVTTIAGWRSKSFRSKMTCWIR